MIKIANSQSTGPPEHLLGCLRGASLFSNLSEKELACFNDAAHARSYKKGKTLYLEGENAESFYVICGGWIKLFHTLPEGEEIIVDMLTTGHMVGESAIFEHGRHTSNAEVIEDAQLLNIPARVLKEQIHSARRSPLACSRPCFGITGAITASLPLTPCKARPSASGVLFVGYAPTIRRRASLFIYLMIKP